VIVVVSPYHLTTREPAAMASLLLAESVVTMLPGVIGRHGGLAGESAQQTAARVPRYRDFVESWAWSKSLWDRGVLRSAWRGASPTDDLWSVVRSMQTNDAWTALRAFFKHEQYPDEATYLSAIAADLLKGGPDPGLSLPVAAGLDRFAARHGVLVARSRPVSIAQQEELRAARSMFAIAIPTLLQASAARLLHWREVLQQERADLHAVMARLAVRVADPRAQGGHDQVALDGEDLSDLRDAAAAYSERCVAACDELRMGSGDDDVRMIEGAVTIAGVLVPWDAVLSSSLRAMERSLGARLSETTDHGKNIAHLPALSDGMAGRQVLALLVKPLGAPVRARR
jgi:hypothetical protein